jgi:hypothetical protein
LNGNKPRWNIKPRKLAFALAKAKVVSEKTRIGSAWAQMATKCHPVPEKTEGGLEKRLKERLVNLWSRKKITKKAHAGRGPETKWEIPIDSETPFSNNDFRGVVIWGHVRDFGSANF